MKRYFWNDILKEIFLRDGEFCERKQVNMDRGFVPLTRQPSQDELLICVHKYCKLKRQPTYERRITLWSRDQTVALFWYKGVLEVGVAEQGNCTKRTADYVCTYPPAVEKLKQDLRTF